MNRDIATLAALAELIKVRELADLAVRLADRRRIEAEIEALHIQGQKTGNRLPDTPARIAAAEDLWAGWSEGRLADLTGEAARAAAKSETALAAARRAFGRAQALHQIAIRTDKPR
ncbi:MAG: hypothetical protein QNJ44_03985 [Rhodobacter sp.]|nr:hypothetical protein [Rhodobacter sp.]